MKHGTLVSGAVLVLVLWGLSVFAESPRSGPTCCKTSECSLPILKGCPDDYCRKPMPVIKCVSCGGPDDYCRMPWPRIWQMYSCGGDDDYDRKPCPSPCRPMDTSQYRCVNLRQCCSTPGRQQPWQGTLPSDKLGEEDGKANAGTSSGPITPVGGATKAMKPLSPYHP